MFKMNVRRKKHGIRTVLTLLAVAALAVSILPNVETASAAEPRHHVYRLYNPNSGDHHYTMAQNERDMLITLGWNNEGIGWDAPAVGGEVYRLYNPNAYCYNHHYTMDKNERDMLIRLGWKNEGLAWYSQINTESAPVYRLYNPNSGEHHYTMNQNEKDMLVTLGWNYEGEAWYGFPASTDNGGTSGGSSGGSTGGNTEPTDPTRDLYAYKTTKYMTETPGCTGKATIKSDYSDWTTSGLKLVPYEYTSLGKPKVRMYAKYFGDLSQYTGYWGPGPKSIMYYGASDYQEYKASGKTYDEWIDSYKAENDPEKYWGKGALTAEDVFSWDCGQKVNAAEYPISEEYVYRRMQARLTEHDDESPYAADNKDTPTSFDDVYKEWAWQWYYEPGLKSGACAAYAADIQDYAFGYAYAKIKYKNISIDDLEKEYGDIYEMYDLYGNGTLRKCISTDIIKKCCVPLRVGDIIRRPNHSSLVTKVYEKNGLIYVDTADGNAAGWTAVNTTVASEIVNPDITIYTRWTELDQNGNLVPLGINDVEYYANGAHKIEICGTWN